MTINNKKNNPVKFDSERHYCPNHPLLPGKYWEVNLDKSSEKIVKDFSDIEVLACPFQEGNLYVSRIKGSPDIGEWIQG